MYREIDGKIILGEIKEKQAAKKQYQEAQQRGESAGYIGTRLVDLIYISVHQIPCCSW